MLSPFLRRRRLRAALPFLAGKVLDVGCGSGSLAQFVAPENYLGVDLDAVSLSVARVRYPQHTFVGELPPPTVAGFDTIVALAVIEHVNQPELFMREMLLRLGPSSRASIVLTTPHPLFDWAHGAGASLGIFSRHAHEEHEAMLGRRQLESLCADCRVIMSVYQKFLFGVNQLAVIRRAK
jgi:2-polyprenyl-3-methyl-5-hydroxy-6-metoxy-1,4-benzoquinol methylase